MMHSKCLPYPYVRIAEIRNCPIEPVQIVATTKADLLLRVRKTDAGER